MPESVLYPREYNDTNVSGTVSIMEAMRDAGIKRVVLASSGAVADALQYAAEHGKRIGEALVELNASDALSGVDATYYRLDGGAQTTYATPFCSEFFTGRVMASMSPVNH